MIVRANDKANEPIHNEHDTKGHHYEDNGFRLLVAVKTINAPVGCQHKKRTTDDPEGQGEEGRWQRPGAYADTLKAPCDQDRGHGAEGHRVTMGEVGEPQDAINQRNTKRAKRELRSVGDGRDQNEI